MKKLFLIVMSVALLTLIGCNPFTSKDFDNLVRIKNFDKYTALGVGNKNTARSARSLTTDYLTSCGLFGQTLDGTYELLIFEDEEGHEVNQSYFLKNFCDNEAFIFISFTEKDEGFSTEFGMGDYTYCVNKENGKMYNIGDRFNRLSLIGSSQYNAYVRSLSESEYKLFRLSFENELLKIEEVFDYSSVPLEIDIEVVDKFGTYANNCFYINKDDEEITRFSESVKLNLGFNDRIYIGNNWFDDGELVTAEFIPEKYEYIKYDINSYKNKSEYVSSYEDTYLFIKKEGVYNVIYFITFINSDEYEVSLKRIYLHGGDFFVINNNFITTSSQLDGIIYKYNFIEKEKIEKHELSSLICVDNTFSGYDEHWNYIEGYIDSEGNIRLDMTEYIKETVKITFVSALN